ncbi:MAG: hypothetical protein FWD97_09615 [Defluviitaleaceae bacterium]|nr:hypothetical protein [Defluviitaleaceae bacterium]
MQMKKTLKLLTILAFSMVVITACGNNNNQAQHPFMPFSANAVLVYVAEVEATGQSFGYTIFNAFIRDNRMQRSLLMDNGDVIIEVMEYQSGSLVNILTGDNMDDEWINPHGDITHLPPTTNFVILPENPQLGDSWRGNPQNPASNLREVTSVGVSVTTPAGTFETIEVTTWNSEGQPTLRTYFAEGVGIVKETGLSFANGIEEISHTTRLIEIAEEGLFGNIHIALPDDYGVMPLMMLQFTTNNDLVDVLNSALVQATDILFDRQLASDAYINRAFINPNTRNLHLDFSAGFLREMGDTPDYETERAILLAIVDTFGSLLNAQGVTITVDDQPYNGTFVSFGSMEFWQVGAVVAQIHQMNVERQEAEALLVAQSLHQPFVDAMATAYTQWNDGSEKDDLRPTLETIFTPHFADDFLAWYFDPEVGLGFEAAYFPWHPDNITEVTVFGNDLFLVTSGDYLLQFAMTEYGEWLIDFIGNL